MSILPYGQSVNDVETGCEQLWEGGIHGGRVPSSTLTQPCCPEFRDVITAEPTPERPSQIFRRSDGGQQRIPLPSLFFSFTCIFIPSDESQS